MKRPSKVVGKAGEAVGRKATTPQFLMPAKPASRQRSTGTALKAKVARLTRERDEALEREKASAEVLRVVSSSPADLQPVFQAMLANATRLCEASYATLWLC